MNFILTQVPQLPSAVKKSSYGPYESDIIMKHTKSLVINNWIEEYLGPWGSVTVLDVKSHQYHITNIKDFICRMYVNKRKINIITKDFE